MALADELSQMDAVAQAQLVRKGEVTASELVEAAIHRVERMNPAINAVVTPMYELAREAAAAPLPEGPFTGVPFILKDLIASYGGVRMTNCSRFLADFVPARDSELVVRHKRAGLIIIGKANASEYGILPACEPVLFGAAHNPWDHSLSTGGSSGGSAAAVASGMVPMAHANDAGGSIRIPASLCGIFGLKPTRGRNSLGPDLGDIMSGLVAEHAVTRTVRDSAALLDATCGPAPGDPYWAPPRERPYSEEIATEPGKLRVAYTAESPSGGEVHADCRAAVEASASLLESLGHHVEEIHIEIDFEMVTQAFTAVYIAGAGWTVEGMARLSGREPTEDVLEPLTWALLQMGRGISSIDYLLAVSGLQMLTRGLVDTFAPYDVVITPTVPEPPYPLGSFDSPPDNPLLGLMRAAGIVPFTALCNLTGLPAMSVPLYWNDAGLPIGTQCIGRFGDEGLLFRLAAQLEAARPWVGRYADMPASG